MKSSLLRYEHFITREMVQKNPDTLFVFGDNLERRGLGGQAAAMRGEHNAVGIPTKKSPGMREEDFFTDNDFEAVRIAILAPFGDLFMHIAEEGKVVWPRDGIGTGLAQLNIRAPKIWDFIETHRKLLERQSII